MVFNAKILLRDLDLLSERQNLKHFNITETVGEAKKVWQSFVYFDICHGIASLRKLYFFYLDLRSSVTYLKCIYLKR